MSYKFTPMTDDELSMSNLMDEGCYSFEVIKSAKRISKSGNPMAELQLRVWDMRGQEHIVYDYLVFSTVNLNKRKVKHFCDAVGLEEEYKNGMIPEELEKYSGKVHIGIQDEMPNPKGGNYPKKNMVIDYIQGNTQTKLKEVNEKEFNDDIPF